MCSLSSRHSMPLVFPWHERRRQTFLGLMALATSALIVLSGCVAPSVISEVRVVDAKASTSGWLHTDGGTIRDAANELYVIKSISWFGLETPECAPHGLWSINLESGLQHIRTMGFNTIRLPYSNECITTGASTSIDYSVNAGLVDRTPLQLMDAVVTAAGAAGLNVILDHHRSDSKAQSELWYTPLISEDQWIADWKMLADRYKDNPVVIGVDLHNEPHGSACWACGNPATDWRAAATRAGNAVLAVNPRLLILIEGIENEADGSATWWGSGLRGVAAYPVTLEVNHRVVYSPHDYPASVYAQKWFSDAAYPANLPEVWDKNWGYIAKQGIAPVLLGEFGTKLESDSDRQWLDQMVTYLSRSGMSYSYWSFNPNSGDTGGLVKDDWRTEETTKILALAPLLVPSTPPSATPTPTPAPPALKPLTSSVPTIAGTNKVGQTLTANPGVWTTGTALAYQWSRSDAAISGAVTAKFTLTAHDLGKSMKVVVSATGPGYTPASRASRSGTTVTPGILIGSTPTITGTTRVGQLLTARPGTWTQGIIVAYQWYRSGIPIRGAVARTYKMTYADRSAIIRVRTIGTRAGYSTLTRFSLGTTRIAP